MEQKQEQNFSLALKHMITISTTVTAPIDRVWEFWTSPDKIITWAFAADTWECPFAENDVQVGGRFLTRMQAKDGSAGFNFEGTYIDVTPMMHIAYTIDGDGRAVDITFEKISETETLITQKFDPEHENSEEMQRSGWQSILNNFKKAVER